MMSDVAIELAPGRRVGPYRLLFQLGKGGMGEVWAAQRAGKFGFEKIVALKVLVGAESGSNSMVMFFDEARAAASLQHAAIVPTMDLDKDGETFFIAMEMVRGPSLTALLQRLAQTRRPMTPAMVAYIGERISSALDYAHSRAAINGQRLELIHRDVSPHNILLDSSGSVRLMDFGVARTAVQDHESRVGTVRGKPSYMSPEQVRSEELDARSDVFSLGTVLYEAGALRRLFGRGQPLKSMAAVLEHEPVAIPKRVPDFPSALWKVIQKALQKDKEKRWANAGELNRALLELLPNLPGSSTVNRDLGALIDETFGADAFDLDSRIRETADQIAVNAEPTSPSIPVPQLESEEDDKAFSEALATNIVWPGAAPGDPLGDPTSMPPPAAGTPNSIPGMPFDSIGSMPVTVQQKQANVGVIAVVGVAAILTLGAVFVFGYKQSEPVEIPTEATVVRQAKPGSIGAVGGAEVEAPVVELKPEPEPAPPKKARPRLTKRVAPKPAKPVAPAPAPAPEPAPVDDAPATRSEVWKLIRRLETVDPGAASSMKATLIEAGGDATKLGALRTKAREALASADGS